MRAALLYLVLVGLPFVGLLAILEVGGRIVPPRSIGGVWELQAVPAGEAPAQCAALALAARSREMRVSQSGPWAQVAFSDPARTSVQVELRGDTLSGALPSGADGGCGLEGVITTAGARETLTGTLRPLACGSCAGLPFRAERRQALPGS